MHDVRRDERQRSLDGDKKIVCLRQILLVRTQKFCTVNIGKFLFSYLILNLCVESSWNVTAHGDARDGKWKGDWRMEWVAVTLHTTSEHGVSSVTTSDAHTSAASNRLNWRPCRFKWTRPFRRKTKSGFCARTITFQTQSNTPGRVLATKIDSD